MRRPADGDHRDADPFASRNNDPSRRPRNRRRTATRRTDRGPRATESRPTVTADPTPLQVGAPRGVGAEPVPARERGGIARAPGYRANAPDPARDRGRSGHRSPGEGHRLGVEPEGPRRGTRVRGDGPRRNEPVRPDQRGLGAGRRGQDRPIRDPGVRARRAAAGRAPSPDGLRRAPRAGPPRP